MWSSLRLKLIKISTYAMIVIIPILVAVALLSLYGSSLDNFYVKTYPETDDIGLSLFITEDFSDSTSYLKFGGVDGIKDTTYTHIPTNIADGIGDKSDLQGLRYLAYSFYLKNTSTEPCDYKMSFYILEETKGVSSSMRISITVDDTTLFYAKAKEIDPGIGEPEQTPDELSGQIINFLSPMTICKGNGSLNVGEYDKYTVVIWLEGEDHECVDIIKGGIITMEMDFEAISQN